MPGLGERGGCINMSSFSSCPAPVKPTTSINYYFLRYTSQSIQSIPTQPPQHLSF